MALTKDRSIEGLNAIWAALIELGESLTEDQWNLDTRCPGWTIRDNYSHMLGTERMLSGDENPTVDVPELDHIKNDIGKINEAWVEERRSRTGAEVLSEFKETVARRQAVLEAMSPEEFQAESWTPAGMDTFGRFMRIRVMDHWLHDQDIREAIGRPGDLSGAPVEISLDELSSFLGYVVGKKSGAPEGSSVAFQITGESPRRIDVVVQGRAGLSDSPVENPTSTLTMPLTAFAAIAGGRHGHAQYVPDVSIEGDQDLGQTVLKNLPTMI